MATMEWKSEVFLQRRNERRQPQRPPQQQSLLTISGDDLCGKFEDDNRLIQDYF